ncbi:MAG: fatty acid desaturase [Oligoflexales bacterium]|nr:fatty acid desaturase [Oligoflexales bacterium]
MNTRAESVTLGASLPTYTSSTALSLAWPSIIWIVGIHLLAFATVPFYFSWGAFYSFVILYFMTGMVGVTLGYHRLLSHRAFKTSRTVERILATFGTLSLQGTPIRWIGTHRIHHAFSDTFKDPHDSSRGFWFSHVGWLMVFNPIYEQGDNIKKFSRDIAKDPYMVWLSTAMGQISVNTALGLALLFIGGVDYFVWGFLARAVVVYHVTWSVNSLTHKFGYKNFKDATDESRNNWLVALLAFGEGWHNNHHTHADVARNGLKWWEIDITYYLIRTLEFLGLAWEVKQPPREFLKS